MVMHHAEHVLRFHLFLTANSKHVFIINMASKLMGGEMEGSDAIWLPRLDIRARTHKDINKWGGVGGIKTES